MLHGLHAHNPEEQEPKDRFRIVIEFVPPLTTVATRQGPRTKDNLRFGSEFLDSVRMVRCIGFRAIGYCEDE